MAEVNLGTLYDFNKEAMKNEKPLTQEEFNEKTQLLAEVMLEYFNDGDHYWMLLCHDRRDYTLFNLIPDNDPTIETTLEELRPTILNRGNVLSIDEQPDGAWEIWIRDFDGEDTFAYYFFVYDKGVVEVYGQ